MSSLFPAIPEWLSYLVGGLTIFVMIASACVIATRAGRNPYWGVLVIVPFFAPVLIWALALVRWPSMTPPNEMVPCGQQPDGQKTDGQAPQA